MTIFSPVHIKVYLVLLYVILMVWNKNYEMSIFGRYVQHGEKFSVYDLGLGDFVQIQSIIHENMFS